MRTLNKIISHIPVSLFLLIVMFNLTVTFVQFSDEVYVSIYYTANEICFFTMNIFMLIICFRNKLCHYNKVSVYGLLSLNIVNFLALSPIMGFENYHSTITHLIMIPLALLVIILLFKKT